MQLHAFSTFIITLSLLGGLAVALDPNCRPGGNFDLTKWDLETSIDNGMIAAPWSSSRPMASEESGNTVALFRCYGS